MSTTARRIPRYIDEQPLDPNEPQLADLAHWRKDGPGYDLCTCPVTTTRSIPEEHLRTISLLREHLPQYIRKSWVREAGVRVAARMAQERYKLDPNAVRQVLFEMGIF